MMRGFDPIRLEWAGQTYVVPADQQMELILRVEDGLRRVAPGLQAAQIIGMPNGVPVAHLSRVWASALAYAGAPVTDLEVYREMMDRASRKDGSLIEDATTGIMQILNLLGADPDDPELADAPEGDAAKKT